MYMYMYERFFIYLFIYFFQSLIHIHEMTIP